jgi:hypothetical protein
MSSLHSTLGALLLLSLGAGGLAAQPIEFTYQGRLLDDQGVPISGDTSAFFSLWQGGDMDTADSGVLAYKELATVTPDATGIFVHRVGTGSPLDATTLDPSDFDFAGDLFLQVAVGTQGNVLLPREVVSGVPYATLAANASDSAQLGGEPPSHYLDLAAHTGNISLAQLPQRSGSIWLPAWVFAPDTRQSSDPAEIWSLGVLPTLTFPAGGQYKASAVVSLPPDFVRGEIRYTLIWCGDDAPGGGTNQVRWNIRGENLTRVDAAYADVTAAVTAADTVIVTTAGSANDLETGDAVAFQIFRLGNVDTYAGTAEVLGLRIDYTAAPEPY